MAEKAEARMKPMMTLRTAGPEEIGIGKDESEGQHAEDGDPDDELAAVAVAYGASDQGARGDRGEEEEEQICEVLDGDMEALDEIEGVVAGEAGEIEVLREDERDEDSEGADDFAAGEMGVLVASAAVVGGGLARLVYQRPTRIRMTMPRMAGRANQAMPFCPCGRTMKAASRGPMAEPVFPPTWKNDWAKPCLPPEAMRAIREDSGWKMAEPTPTREDA